MEKIDFETVLVEASRLPVVNVDREMFLRNELRNRYGKEVVDMAIEHNPAYAGIDVEDINRIAKSCIDAETTRVTLLSAASGLPGGLALFATVPADLVQYFAHILRIMQELMYLYGWQELEKDGNGLTEETKNIITLFVGIMFGVDGAVNAVNRVAAQAAEQVLKKLPEKALTKGVIYPIVKKICQILGVKMTKQLFAKSVSKAVPILGAAASGGLTYVSYKPMANKLKDYLSNYELADVDYYKEIRNKNVIDVKVEYVDE